MTFEEWMAAVDQWISARAGVGASDLSDQPYRDWYDDGTTPYEAGRMALKANGFNFGFYEDR